MTPLHLENIRWSWYKNKENDNTSNFDIKLENNVITNESDVAEVCNDYFTNIQASKFKEQVKSSDTETLNNFIGSKVPSNTEIQIPFTNQTFIRK